MPPPPVPTGGNVVVVASCRIRVGNHQRWPDRSSAPVLLASCLPLAPPFRHCGRHTTSWEVAFQNATSSTETAFRRFLVPTPRTAVARAVVLPRRPPGTL